MIITLKEGGFMLTLTPFGWLDTSYVISLLAFVISLFSLIITIKSFIYVRIKDYSSKKSEALIKLQESQINLESYIDKLQLLALDYMVIQSENKQHFDEYIKIIFRVMDNLNNNCEKLNEWRILLTENQDYDLRGLDSFLVFAHNSGTRAEDIYNRLKRT
jgi:hypothetical protein